MPPDQDRGGVVPLLGLEPTNTENVEENDPTPDVESFESSLNPLLGTIFLSGCIRKRPEKSMKLDTFRGFDVRRHPAEFVEIDGTLRYI